MLPNRRSVSVTGRTRMLEKNSSGTSRSRIGPETPEGIVACLR